MEPVPGESQAKKEMMERNIAELLQLKEAVALKRRQLKAMGINDDPELKSKLIKYPDAQAKYKQAKQAKQTAVPEDVIVKPVAAPVPANSPFIDPNAKTAPAPIKEQVKVQAPAPAPVQAPVQVQTPVPAPVPAPVRPVRISHDGRWF
jgi:hypothetical protein